MTTIDNTNEVKADNFHQGEKPSVESASTENTPTEIVRQFIDHRSVGVKGTVESTVVYANGAATFKLDAEKHKQFLQALHEAKVLSDDDVKAGLLARSGSAASKMKKISEYAHIILDPRILPLLSPGYSILYEFANLAEVVEGGQEGADKILEILLTSKGPIKRKWLEKQRKKIAKELASHAAPKDVTLQQIAPNEAPSLQPSLSSDTKPEMLRPVVSDEVKQPITAVLMSVTSKDIVSRLEKAIQENGQVNCLTLREDIDDDAMLLVRTKVSTLLSMSAIVKSLGFDRCSRIGLISEPVQNDIASSEVMAVYTRGEMKIASDAKGWLGEKDATKLASRILECVSGRRVHLFAKSPSDGWTSVIDDDNWRMSPVA